MKLQHLGQIAASLRGILPPIVTTITRLLMHFNTATGVSDECGHAVQTVTSPYGSPTVTGEYFKFGDASLKIFAGNSYLNIADAANLSLGNQPFTIEFFMRDFLTSGYQQGDGFVDIVKYQEPVNGSQFRQAWSVQLRGIYCKFVQDLAPGSSEVATTSAVNDGVMKHIAITRDLTGTLSLFVGGILHSSVPAPLGNFATGGSIQIGTGYSSVDYNSVFLDELRISTGTPRYTTNFTPPTSAFTL